MTTPSDDEAAQLRAMHREQRHSEWEYATTTSVRKQGDPPRPNGNGWMLNQYAGRDGWERFDAHEEAYWRRPKLVAASMPEPDDVPRTIASPEHQPLGPPQPGETRTATVSVSIPTKTPLQRALHELKSAADHYDSVLIYAGDDQLGRLKNAALRYAEAEGWRAPVPASDVAMPPAVAVTIEQCYPICANPLRTMRDTAASAFDRIDAARILIEMGLDRHPLMRDDVRAAARGELGKILGEPEPDRLVSARPAPEIEPAVAADPDQHMTVSLRGVSPHAKAREEIMSTPYPRHVRVLLAVRDALIELGAANEPIPRTDYGFALVRDAVRYRLGSDAVQVTGDDRGRLRVEALGVEVVW